MCEVVLEESHEFNTVCVLVNDHKEEKNGSQTELRQVKLTRLNVYLAVHPMHDHHVCEQYQALCQRVVHRIEETQESRVFPDENFVREVENGRQKEAQEDPFLYMAHLIRWKFGHRVDEQ